MTKRHRRPHCTAHWRGRTDEKHCVSGSDEPRANYTPVIVRPPWDAGVVTSVKGFDMATTTQISTTRSRTLHLIDLENLIANPGLLRELMFESGSECALRPVRGQDAADLYLLAGAPPEWVAKRFGRVVIGSGDHIFATRARMIRNLGVQVTVVSRSDSLSGALQGQGFSIRLFESTTARQEVACAA